MENVTNKSKLIAGLNGGSVSGVSADGEVLWTLGLPAGHYDASAVLLWLSEGDTLQLDGEVSVFDPPARTKRANLGALATQSGANPEFRVTSASRMVRELDLKLRSLNQTDAKLKARLAALDDLRERKAKVQAERQAEAEPVVEDEPAPAPAAEGGPE